MSVPTVNYTTGTLSQAVADLIESVAMVESGLSHILNAEGEKIQFFLGTEGITPAQLLSVNSSVQAIVADISVLEQALAAKVQAAVSIL